MALDENAVGVGNGDGFAGDGCGTEAGGVELGAFSFGGPDGAGFAVDGTE